LNTSKPSIFPALLCGLLLAGTAKAQQETSCLSHQVSDPPRVVLSCANGLVIEAEMGSPAPFGAFDAAPSAVEVKKRGVLVVLPPGSGPFQIKTPHAIASVRGTVFVVDATNTDTSVFVVEGVVAVSRRDGTDLVELGAGDGVAVSYDAPLTVKQWPFTKVSALLARFDR